MQVLALNSGSSSLKFGLYRVAGGAVTSLLSGEIESVGSASAVFHASNAQGKLLLRESSPMAHEGDSVARVVKADRRPIAA